MSSFQRESGSGKQNEQKQQGVLKPYGLMHALATASRKKECSMYWWLCAFFVIGLMGCSGSFLNLTQEPVDCTRITEELNFARSQISNTAEAVLENVEKEYGIRANETGEWAGDGVYWERAGHAFAAVIAPNQTDLQRIVIRWDKAGPSGETVLDCLGPPQFYRARIEQEPETAGVYFELWYADEGVILSRSGFMANDGDALGDPPAPTMIFTRATIVNASDPAVMQDLAFHSP